MSNYMNRLGICINGGGGGISTFKLHTSAIQIWMFPLLLKKLNSYFYLPSVSVVLCGCQNISPYINHTAFYISILVLSE